MLERTEEVTKIRATTRDDFILSLNEAIVTARNPREKLFHIMLRDSGVRWNEMAEEALEGDLPPAEAIVGFIAATNRYITWMMATMLDRFFDPEKDETAIKNLIDDISTDLTRQVKARRAINKEDDE